MHAGHTHDLDPPFQRHGGGGGVLRLGRQADDAPAMAAAGEVQRLGDHAMIIQRDRRHLGPVQARGTAETGIGEFLAVHIGAVAAQAALQRDVQAILPASVSATSSAVKVPSA